MKKLAKKIYQKACVNQWSIGFAKLNISEVITNKTIPHHFHWLPVKHNLNFIADPFIYRTKEGKLLLFYEDFSTEQNGFIALKELDDNFNTLQEKILLKTNTHLSYPFIVEENGKVYIIPETQQTKQLIAYEFNTTSYSLENSVVLINNIGLLDATFVHHNNKYWFFATSGDGTNYNKQLNIFYADKLFGNYKPHKNNPVKNNLDGSRPAGAIIAQDGILYRPSQNCKEYYGKSITMHKIITLSEEEFKEDFYCILEADQFNNYNKGIHTINAINGIVVIDGIKMLFKPFLKLKLFLKEIFKQEKVIKSK